MIRMQIFEPPMCSETGLCSGDNNDELFRIATIIEALRKNGIFVDRYNLNLWPGAFENNNTVKNFIKKNGEKDLPIVLIDDEIVISGRYPTTNEFLSLLEITEDYINGKKFEEDKQKAGDFTCC